MPSYPEDWLMLAGDIGETTDHLHYALSRLTRRFAQVLWAPAIMNLWTLPTQTTWKEDAASARRSQIPAIGFQFAESTGYLHQRTRMFSGLVRDASAACSTLLLYDYSFRPDEISEEQAFDWGGRN